MLVSTMAFSYIRDDISSKQSTNQSRKKTDFTADLIWWPKYLIFIKLIVEQFYVGVTKH